MDMPDFLQSKQSTSVKNSYISEVFKDKRKLSVISLVVLLLAIPLTVWLAQRTQIFSPKAGGAPIELVTGGDCVVSTNPNKVNCPTFPIRLTSPLGPTVEEATPSPSLTASSSPLPSPNIDASPSPSASAVISPSPSPSASAAVSPSPSPSPSAVSAAACVSSKLGLSSPTATADVNNKTILYWRSPVSIAQLTSAASECGVSLLNPTNFTNAALETLVRNNSGGTARSIWVEGPCTDQKVAAYQSAGIKVSGDVQCNPPDTELDYKVFPSPNSLDGIGDFGSTGGDPAVVIPASSASSFDSGFYAFFSKLIPQANAQSPSIDSITSCVGTALGLSNPVNLSLANNKSNRALVYWNQSVNRENFFQKAADCGATILKPGNFTGDDVKSLVTSVTGAPSSTSDDSKYRQVIIEGPCTAAKVNEYRNTGYTVLADSQCDEPGLDYKVNQPLGPTSGLPQWGIYSGIADGGNNGYPMIIAEAGGTSSVSPTSLATSSPSASIDPSSRTVKYRAAETEAGLAAAEFKPYSSHPLVTDFTFIDADPGVKQIWVEFVSNSNQSRIEHISVELGDTEPMITSLDCSMDISKQNLKITLNGSRLGESGGKVTVGSAEAQILSWNPSQVNATIKPEGSLNDGREFKVKLTRNDNVVFPETVCRVNTTLISLGARLFCREPGKFDVNGVRVVLVDENGNKVNEEVSVDANGVVQGLKTRLQTGKSYAASIKVPYSLRRNGLFTASEGTNIVTPEEGSIFILPVGDIAPSILADGKINTLDRSELVRQWSVLGGGGQKAGDFNRDSKVNSIDWACMRYDFNKEDDGIPEKTLPSGSPVPGVSIAPTSSPVTSSPTALPSPLPSGQRSAYFLLEPVEGGSYKNDDEFIVNVNIWSQAEAANLFAAKMSFDKDALEVVRIEKGTTLTTWAEEFFNNQTGKISLVAGKPTPGLKTTEGNDTLMAKIIFRAKKVGNTELTLTSDSKIYSDKDNTNILTSLLSAQIEITN